MPTGNYFRIVWADNGDVTIVPDETQPSGDVSFNQGYTVDYELEDTDPNYKDIERAKFNYVMNQVTLALQHYQQNGTPPFITTLMNGGTPFAYAKYARVLEGGIVYTSLIDNNTDTPPSSNWTLSTPVESGGTGRATLTKFSILAGDNVSPVAFIAPSAGTGLPLISQGSLAYPLFGIAAIAGGGTGAGNALDGFNNLKQAATDSFYGVTSYSINSEAQAATASDLSVTPANLAATVIGIGQTWQDVIGSRVQGTSYRNTTGRPIQVNIMASGNSSFIQTSSDNTTWINVGRSGSDRVAGGYFIVPNNWYYKLAGSPGNDPIVVWSELR